MIRKMCQADIGAVLAVIEQNWPRCEMVKRSVPLELADMFSTATYRPTFFVAEERGQIVGCGGWNFAWHNYDMYELFWGNVLPSHQGRGLGRALTQVRLNDIRRDGGDRHLYVTISTHLDALYSRFGFRTVATMDSIIETGEPKTHLMLLEMPGT